MLTVDFARLELRPGMAVLDAGCGQGRHSLELMRRGCALLALDLNPADLRYTRYLLASLRKETNGADKGSGSGSGGGTGNGTAHGGGTDSVEPPLPPFSVLQSNALHLPFPDRAFDRVLCSEVLEHVTDPSRATAELTRVLKPGGMLALSVPTPVTEWVYRYSSDDYFNTPGGHVRIFTVPRLRALLAGHGLTVTGLHFEHSFHSLYWWVRCVFGLHAEAHPVIRHFKNVLTHIMFSPILLRAERWGNWLLPKSMVIYAIRSGGIHHAGNDRVVR